MRYGLESAAADDADPAQSIAAIARTPHGRHHLFAAALISPSLTDVADDLGLIFPFRSLGERQFAAGLDARI
jgi:hypothetical protein